MKKALSDKAQVVITIDNTTNQATKPLSKLFDKLNENSVRAMFVVKDNDELVLNVKTLVKTLRLYEFDSYHNYYVLPEAIVKAVALSLNIFLSGDDVDRIIDIIKSKDFDINEAATEILRIIY